MEKRPKLEVREVQPEDGPLFDRYWAETTDADLERMGELARPTGNAEFLAEYCAKRLPPEQNDEGILVWLASGKPIGYSTLKDIRFGKDAQIHLHMWDKTTRRKGYGAVLFCLSAQRFRKDFHLQELYCQPKHDNPMPNGMLRKVGFEEMEPIGYQRRDGSRILQSRYRITPQAVEAYLEQG